MTKCSQILIHDISILLYSIHDIYG